MAPRAADGVNIKINAYTGSYSPKGSFADTYGSWAVERPALELPSLIPSPAEASDWQDERIGWGLILPDRPGTDDKALARADDAPEPIRALLKARKGKVLRYRQQSYKAPLVLRDYCGGVHDLLAATSPSGMGTLELPMYLLICASPQEVPWEVQYSLNLIRYVGRIDLDEKGLTNYVEALLNGWADSEVRYDAPVVWSVDNNEGDILSLMREAIADPVYRRLSHDKDMPNSSYQDGSKGLADRDRLYKALTAQKPALIVTTSHGMTGPMAPADEMRSQLGALIDQEYTPVSTAVLLDKWQPDGAIWFAQACCSAGTNSPSAYKGLFSPSDPIGEVLEATAQFGALSSPLSQALLGASKPLRAFIGQVEPTFNWTMEFPPNRLLLTSHTISALYEGMCFGRPVGLSMEGFYGPIASLLYDHTRALTSYSKATGAASVEALDMALYTKVTAYDRAGTVILGDPTVALELPTVTVPDS